ncbi:MAG: HPr(Ser) kinase/phosphatase [Clostridia bacterium]|nr:HPr(Ser) kinase/phosphatase [Clostridia bacterium]
MISPGKLAKALGLKTIVPASKRSMRITVADICRPGLQFAGFFDFFANERPQVIGWTEMHYLLSLPENVQRERLHRYFSYEMPCIVIARGMSCPAVLEEGAREHGVAVYATQEETSAFTARAIGFLLEELAPRQTCHAVLVDVFGVGVLITGESGVGKSECALELIKRGHLLVADDVVDIARVGPRLRGESPEIVRELMELRGIGIVNIKSIFGIGAVLRRKTIDMVIQLELWSPDRDYDRLGSKAETTNILGIDLPRVVIPVRSGRNLAIIVEIAARNWRLTTEGNDAVSELERRMQARYSQMQEDDEEE